MEDTQCDSEGHLWEGCTCQRCGEVEEEYMNQLMHGGTLIAQIPPPPPPDEEQEGFEGVYRRVLRVLLLEVVREYRRAQRIPQTTVGRK